MLCCLQGWTLLLAGPFLDRFISGRWVMSFQFGVPVLMVLAVSCGCAVFVNLSQFMCLGRFSAVSFQVCACDLRVRCYYRLLLLCFSSPQMRLRCQHVPCSSPVAFEHVASRYEHAGMLSTYLM